MVSSNFATVTSATVTCVKIACGEQLYPCKLHMLSAIKKCNNDFLQTTLHTVHSIFFPHSFLAILVSIHPATLLAGISFISHISSTKSPLLQEVSLWWHHSMCVAIELLDNLFVANRHIGSLLFRNTHKKFPRCPLVCAANRFAGSHHSSSHFLCQSKFLDHLQNIFFFWGYEWSPAAPLRLQHGFFLSQVGP